MSGGGLAAMKDACKYPVLLFHYKINGDEQRHGAIVRHHISITGWHKLTAT